MAGPIVTQEYVPVACGWIWHPKVVGLSFAARGLWISGLCYAGTTGGVIPATALKALTPDGDLRSIRWPIKELLARHLWDIAEITQSNPGITYEIHDFDEHCSWLAQRRERDRARQQKRREALTTSRDKSVTVTPEREREQGTVNKEHTPKPPKGAVVVVAVDSFVRTWNGHCDPLPKLRKAPSGANDVRLMVGAVEYFDGDLNLLGAAAERAALDPHYREHRYGFETFCRHVDRWGDAPPVLAVVQAGDAQRAAAFDERWAAMVAKGPGPDPRSSTLA